jgi:hypothetical protein
MNDDFLKQWRKRPDPQFAEALYQRISKEKQSVWIMKRVAWTLATLSLLLVMAFTVSPTVRATVLATMRQVGILQIVELPEFPSVQEGQDGPIVEWVSLANAQERLGAMALPAHVPEGFELQQSVMLVEMGELAQRVHLAELAWRKEELIQEPDLYREIFIRLQVAHHPDGTQQPSLGVGEGGVESIEINGQPAAIVRGAWSVDSQAYEAAPLLQIVWQMGDRTVYTLLANEELVPVEDLIAMAESVLP